MIAQGNSRNVAAHRRWSICWGAFWTGQFVLGAVQFFASAPAIAQLPGVPVSNSAPFAVKPLDLIAIPAAPVQPVAIPVQAVVPQKLPVSSPQTNGAQPAPISTPGSTPTSTPPDPVSSSLFNPLKNPLLSPTPGTMGGSPQANPATKLKLDKYIQKVLDPETTFDIVADQTRVLLLKGVPFRIQAGDERYLAVNIVNPKEILLQGREVGSTVLNIWFGDANDPSKQETITYLVRIYPDPEAKERLDRAYKALEDDINRYFKDCSVRLKVVGDKVMVSGRVRDTVQGSQVIRIITANSTTGGVNTAGDAGRVPLQAVGALENPTTGLEAFRASGGPSIINLFEVAGEQQVMLRVIVAEVNRSAARSVGMNFGFRNSQGIQVFTNNTGGLLAGSVQIGAGNGLNGINNNTGIGGTTNLSLNLDAGKIPLAIEALKSLSYAKSLAEPTLVTMNGQTANFLAGGQYPVPVVTAGNAFGGLQGVQFVPYGVQLTFTPFITDRDRVRLNFSATVSSRDLSAGANIGGANVAGLTARNVNTTVELR